MAYAKKQKEIYQKYDKWLMKNDNTEKLTMVLIFLSIFTLLLYEMFKRGGFK